MDVATEATVGGKANIVNACPKNILSKDPRMPLKLNIGVYLKRSFLIGERKAPFGRLASASFLRPQSEGVENSAGIAVPQSGAEN